jgi:glycosyltransferase involved in cell wall biosynthesis
VTAVAPETTGEISTVSVVVLSKDEPQLARTLERLRPQCDAIGAECLVVDASAGRMEDVHQAHRWVEWVDFVGPLGVKVTIPHQRNLGVRRSQGSIVAFCDAGGLPEEGWLASLIGPIAAGRSEATCGPLLPEVPGIMDPANDLPDGAPIEIAITANMAFLRTAFGAVGGFDERYRYGSDTDFGFRLLDGGFRITCAADARMKMDWGDTDRSIKRARHYGKGNVLLFLTHPRRARTVVRLWPDTIAYPLWIVGMVLLAPVAFVALWVPVGWLLLLCVPIARNRRAPDLRSLLRVKLVRAVSFLTGWVSVPLHRDIPVLMVPENHQNPYLDELCTALQGSGVAVTQLSMGPTASQTLNTLLLLPRLTWRRMRGARILHLHWTYDFAWWWAANVPFVRRAPRWWFTTLLAFARLTGFRIVYTAHNVLPHSPVFDDDRAARAALLRRSDEVITLTDAAKSRLRDEFGVPESRVTVVPEGAPRISRAVARSTRPDRSLAVMFGHLDRYKGVDLLLEAATAAGGAIDVELLGEVSDPGYVQTLRDGLERLRGVGGHAQWQEHRFTTEALECLLERATMVVFPFREITNSTSLRVAMSHRVPCVLPSLPALAEVPRAAAYWCEPDDVGDLTRALDAVVAATGDERASVCEAAVDWLTRWSWDRVGATTREVYERALREANAGGGGTSPPTDLTSE